MNTLNESEATATPVSRSQGNRATLRTVVMTMAAGYGVAKVEPLLRSVSTYSPNVTIVMFVDRIRSDVREFTRQLRCKVILVPFSPARRGACWLFLKKYYMGLTAASALAMLPQESGIRRWLASYVLHPATARFILYRQWLERHAGEFDQVFMVDVRDVVVLRDLTAARIDRVTVAEEGKAVVDDALNLAWLFSAGYAPDEVHRLIHRKIICSGTIAAPMDQALEYLAAYEAETVRMISGVGNRFLEQCMVIWLATREPWASRTTVLPCRNRILMNLGTSSTEELVWLAEPGADRWPAVVHQYDRSEQVTAALERDFPGLPLFRAS